MKKIMMTLAAAIIAVSASAQVYVGGGFGIGTAKVKVAGESESVTAYKFVPEVGYNFTDELAAGVAFGWEGMSKGNQKTVEVNPYARYTFFRSQYVNVFVDGGVGFAHTYGDGSDVDDFSVGLRPGVAVNLNKKLSFVTHVGFFGYENKKDNNTDVKVNAWSADLDGRNITFGLYYNF